MMNISKYMVAVAAISPIINLNICSESLAQSNAQWPFYLAFEDATGARDTVWLVLDENALYPNEQVPELGEILINPDQEDFFVYSYQLNNDGVYKTIAYPSYYPGFEAPIWGENYILPLTCTWDTSLFHAPFLYETGDPVIAAYFDSQYFFLASENGNTFDLTSTDSVEMPEFGWGGGNHFPMTVYITRGIDTGVGVSSPEYISTFNIYPNPMRNDLQVESTDFLNLFRIIDANGKTVQLTKNAPTTQMNIDVSALRPGVYFLMASDGIKRGVQKFVKE